MENIRQYLLSVIVASIISALVIRIIGKTGAFASLIKLLAGVFLIITVIAPWTMLKLNDLSSYFSDIQLQASHAAQFGESLATDAKNSIIRTQIEAYILDKASELDVNIEVEVILAETEPHLPESVAIRGTVSPFGKQRLGQIIADELGIPKEKLLWI